MELQYFLQVYNSYIKYIYYLIAIIIIIVLVTILKKLVALANSLTAMANHGENIANSLNEISKKAEVIDHTCQTSIPFFTKLFLVVSILNETTKDFFNTKTSKRNIRKSFKKVCKIQKRIDPSFSFSKVLASIIK